LKRESLAVDVGHIFLDNRNVQADGTKRAE